MDLLYLLQSAAFVLFVIFCVWITKFRRPSYDFSTKGFKNEDEELQYLLERNRDIKRIFELIKFPPVSKEHHE